MSIDHTIQEVDADGVKGLIIHIENAPVTQHGIHFRAGNNHDDRAWPYQTGHVLEHIAYALTTNQDYGTKNEFIQAMQKNGASTNALTTSNGISYYGDSISEEWERLVNLRRIPLENPRIDESSLAAEVGNVNEELRQYVGRSERLAWELSRKALTNGAWLTASESIDSTKSISASDVAKHYTQTHTIQNMRFIVVGDAQAAGEKIEDIFGRWELPRGKRVEPYNPDLIQGGVYAYERRDNLQNISNSFSISLPRMLSNEERETLNLINYVLYNSHTSRVLGTARDEGICYSMHGSVDIQTKTQTTWELNLPVGAVNMPRVINLIVKHIDDIRKNGLEDKEFEDAKQYRLGRAKKLGQTAGELYDIYAEDFFVRDRVIFTQDREAVYSTMTNSNVSRLLNELIDCGYWSLGGVGSIDENEYKKHYDLLANYLNRR